MGNVLKWIGILLIAVLTLPFIAGAVTRYSLKEASPPGKLYDIGSVRLHIDCAGSSNNKPTVIVESGAASPTPNYHWLKELLKNDVRICRYDRAGLGWSDDSKSPRDADTITSELKELLTAADIGPPYIMAGHSLGGALLRVYADRYPGEVVGMVFIDASHPDQYERMGLTPELLDSQRGVFHILRFAGAIGLAPLMYNYTDDGDDDYGLPEEAIVQLKWINRNGRLGKEGLKESEAVPTVLDRAIKTGDFGDVPVRVFTAPFVQSAQSEALLEQGVDLSLHEEIQTDLTKLSTDSEHFIIAGATHTSIVTDRIHAAKIANQIIDLVSDYSADNAAETQETDEGQAQ